MADRDLCGHTLGEFVLQEQIGEGGCGTVYRCFQPSLQRHAVIKVLRDRQRSNSGARERFLREAQLASQLDHPFAAHVYAFSQEPDGVLWIAMELVQGTTLDAWLRAHGPMPPEQFVPFFLCVLEVVAAAHERGIVHRDLKPSNVMVIERGGRLIPKLLDFGIAKADGDGVHLSLQPLMVRDQAGRTPVADGPLTNTDPPERDWHLTPSNVGIGSAPYMSPEQWDDAHAVGPASDVYSLGILAYKTLTGRVPFAAESDRECREQHLDMKVPPLGGDLSQAFDRVIDRALAKKPKDRYGSALEFASELREMLQASELEVLRSSSQQWAARGRDPSLLLRGRTLEKVDLWTRRAPTGTVSELECSFVAASQRRARRVRWAMRALAVAVAAIAGVTSMWRWALHAQIADQQAQLAETEARAARRVTEAKITESELEQGRAGLLHGEPEALRHLSEAYGRDHAPSTAFMLARAMQPRLSELASLPATHGRMWWATFSPDGSRIATADDRAAQIWDAKTYRLLFTLPHGCEVYQAIYSPDGLRLVTIAQATVRIWDAAHGTMLHSLKARQAPPDFFRGAISSDGRLVAVMDARGSSASVWDTERGALVAELRNRAVGFPALSFGADGWLATTGGEEARVFDVRGWKQVLAIPGPVRSLAFGARSRLAAGSETGEVALWDVRNASRLRQLRSSGEPVDAVVFSPDGSLVAAGSRDGLMQAWRADTGVPQGRLNPRHGKVLWVEFGPDATSFLAAHADGTVVVADVAQGLALATLDGPRNKVVVARFDAGLRVVAASWDGTTRVWEAASPYRSWSTAPVGDACNIGMGSRPDRRFIAVGCRDLPTRVWDTAHDRLLAELPNSTPMEANGFISASPAVSAGGDLAVIARGTATALYGLPGGRLIRTLDHGAAVSAIAFADSGRAMASGALDGSVRVVREDGAELALQASGGITALTFLADGRVIVADAERHLRAYAADGTTVADLPLPVRVMSLRGDADRFVALPNLADEAGSPLLIDLAPPRIVARLVGHVGQVFSARWVSGGRVLTAGDDGTARLWDGATGRLLQTYHGGPRFLADADLVSGVVVGGDADGLLRFWDAASGARLWTLPVHKSAVLGVHLEGSDLVTRGFTGEIARWRLPQSGAVIDACARSVPCAIVP